VTGYRLSRRADEDLLDIAAYGEARWGEAVALAYLDRLQAAAQRVANMPGLARPCDTLRPGYRRIEEGSHVLLMKQDAAGLLVVRILHARQLPTLNLFTDDEQE
jgi:toxin ParE1/3/4